MPWNCCQSTDVVFGSDHALKLVQDSMRVSPARSRLPETIAALGGAARASKRLAIVASGDPLFYGVARYLCDRLGKEHFEVLPHVSSMQFAFARVKETWEDAYLTNLQTYPLDTVLDRIRTAETVGLFPSENEGPPEIARQLLARGLDYFRMYVCENLGGPDERVTQGELSDIQDMEFAPLNVVILGVNRGDQTDRRRRASSALRQRRRRVRAEPAQERPHHPGGSAGDCAGNWRFNRRALSGTSALVPVRWQLRRPG